MTLQSEQIQNYLIFCKQQKKLSVSTTKAYGIDLSQFFAFHANAEEKLTRNNICDYITHLHETYKPRTAKRKIASLKAFCRYLECEELIEKNPFDKINIKFQEPRVLPRTIPISDIQIILKTAYNERQRPDISEYYHAAIIRDIAVLELLFATGMRVSELCSLKHENINFSENIIRVFGKGSKERVIQISNKEVIDALLLYILAFQTNNDAYFFVNRLGNRLSEQSVRFMIRKYVELAGISSHITPHMFRHSCKDKFIGWVNAKAER